MGRGGGSLDVQDAMCTLSDMGDRGHEAGHTHGQEGFREQDETDTQKALPRRPPGLRGQKAPLRFAQCQLGQGQAAGKGAGGWGCSEAAKMPKKKRGRELLPPPVMLPVRWQEGVSGVQKRAETELGVWPAHSTGNDPGKQDPSPACVQVRVFTDHRPWTSSLGAPCSRKVPVFSNNCQS